MKRMSRFMVGLATGIAVLASASMAEARPRWGGSGWSHGYRHDRGGLSTGDVLLGALVIGGVAAAVAASNRDNSIHVPSPQDGPPPGYRLEDKDGRAENGAVNRCAAAAEAETNRRFGQARVIGIGDVDRQGDTVFVRGRLSYADAERVSGEAWKGERVGSSDFRCAVRLGQVLKVDVDALYAMR